MRATASSPYYVHFKVQNAHPLINGCGQNFECQFMPVTAKISNFESLTFLGTIPTIGTTNFGPVMK